MIVDFWLLIVLVPGCNVVILSEAKDLCIPSIAAESIGSSLRSE